MASNEPKTQPTDVPVADFLNALPDERNAEDCRTIVRMMEAATGAPPVMWGTGIVGFGSSEYRYASGRTGVWPDIAFAPRKRELVLYLTFGFEHQAELLAQLGPHKISKACLYIKRLDQINLDVLEKMLYASVKQGKNAR